MTPKQTKRLAEIRATIDAWPAEWGVGPEGREPDVMARDLLALYDAIADGSAVREARAREREALQRAGEAEARADAAGLAARQPVLSAEYWRSVAGDHCEKIYALSSQLELARERGAELAAELANVRAERETTARERDEARAREHGPCDQMRLAHAEDLTRIISRILGQPVATDEALLMRVAEAVRDAVQSRLKISIGAKEAMGDDAAKASCLPRAARTGPVWQLDFTS